TTSRSMSSWTATACAWPSLAPFSGWSARWLRAARWKGDEARPRGTRGADAGPQAPRTGAIGSPMEIASADLAPIRELYGKSLYLQALRQAEQFGPLRQWSNAPARLLGGRLAIQLGAPRLGRWLHLRAYRDTPTHLEAIYYHARYRLEK